MTAKKRNNDTPVATQPKESAFAAEGLGKTVKAICEEIRELYQWDQVPWVIGYSGGKDSTAILGLIWLAVKELPPEKRTKKIYVISTDTLVEQPLVAAWVDASHAKMREAADAQGMPVIPHKLLPAVKDTFWVNLIGKGYGNRASCSKKSEKSYEQFLREAINRGVPPGQGAAIRLSFQYASEGQQHTYEIHRQWAVKGNKVKEDVIVRKNGEIDRWLSDNWAQQVEDLLPQGISQLCFFDAEKIRFLAEEETSNATLGNAIKSLLGLDLAERLIADANVLEGKIAKRARPSEEKQEVEALEAILSEKSTQTNESRNNNCRKARSRFSQYPCFGGCLERPPDRCQP